MLMFDWQEQTRSLIKLGAISKLADGMKDCEKVLSLLLTHIWLLESI